MREAWRSAAEAPNVMWPREQYTGPGGGLYTGPRAEPYHSNQPPRAALLKYLAQNGRKDLLRLLDGL